MYASQMVFGFTTKKFLLISYFPMQVLCTVHFIPLYTTILIILAEGCSLRSISLGPCKFVRLYVALLGTLFIPLTEPAGRNDNGSDLSSIAACFESQLGYRLFD